MNEKFYELPIEKQDAMLNGAMNVFARYDYKHAATDEIVEKAGISKGLLFHYFNSKKELYLYLYQYATKYVIKEMSVTHDYEETDFFKIIINAQMSKMKIMQRHPDLMLFMMKAYYETSEAVKNEVNQDFQAILANSSKRFLERADGRKIKEEVSKEQLLNILLWMAEGFMRSRTEEQLKDIEAINTEYLQYMDVLRNQFYKEEYL